MRIQDRQSTALALVIATAGWAGTGHAQSAVASGSTAPARKGSNLTLETVLVTAAKRSQSIEKMPASITAITAAGLARANIVDVKGLSAQVPDFTIGSNGHYQWSRCRNPRHLHPERRLDRQPRGRGID